MAYTIPEIITWAKIAQPLARVGEAKRLADGDDAADVDLDIKLYMTRKDVEYAYAQNSDSAILHTMGNYLLMLCGVYLFQAQQTNVGGGIITPITPGTMPDPYDFEVDGSSFIATGETTKIFPTSWQGLNMLFVRNNITQSTVNQGASYYSWDKTTRTFTLINGAANAGELFQIYPII
jgi:hypothetical protein